MRDARDDDDDPSEMWFLVLLLGTALGAATISILASIAMLVRP